MIPDNMGHPLWICAQVFCLRLLLYFSFFSFHFGQVCKSKQMLHFLLHKGGSHSSSPPALLLALLPASLPACLKSSRPSVPAKWPINRFVLRNRLLACSPRQLNNFPTRSFCVSSFDLSLSSRPLPLCSSAHPPASLHSPLTAVTTWKLPWCHRIAREYQL